MTNDSAFEMAASNIRFGPGVTREIGWDLAEMKVQRVMVLTDPVVATLPPVATTLQSLSDAGVRFSLYDRVRVEPTDTSFKDAVRFAIDGAFDAFVAVGGGSTIDTAKAANLYSTYPAEFFDYVNPPIGKGIPVPGPLKPLIAVPTTAGTGSETTGVSIFDYVEMGAKTGIAHRRLKPCGMMGTLELRYCLRVRSRFLAFAPLEVAFEFARCDTTTPPRADWRAIVSHRLRRHSRDECRS